MAFWCQVVSNYSGISIGLIQNRDRCERRRLEWLFADSFKQRQLVWCRVGNPAEPLADKKEEMMILKDLKDKDGKGLLPEERSINKECPQPYSQAYETLIPKIQGYNQCLKDLADKDIRDYVEVDVDKIHTILTEFAEAFMGDGRFYVKETDFKHLAQAIAKVDILKSRG